LEVKQLLDTPSPLLVLLLWLGNQASSQPASNSTPKWCFSTPPNTWKGQLTESTLH
jgi:hypothetical protein